MSIFCFVYLLQGASGENAIPDNVYQGMPENGRTVQSDTQNTSARSGGGRCDYS